MEQDVLFASVWAFPAAKTCVSRAVGYRFVIILQLALFTACGSTPTMRCSDSTFVVPVFRGRQGGFTYKVRAIVWRADCVVEKIMLGRTSIRGC